MIEEFADGLVAISRHFGVLERDRVCCGDVTPPQCVALQRLLDDPAGLSALASYLGKSDSATTRLVDGLEDRGWAVRRPDPEDGRRVQIALTDEGRERAAELWASTEQTVGALLDYIPEERREEVVRSLSLLEEALAECRTDCCGTFDEGA